MPKGVHQNHTTEFGNLSFGDQSKSISALVMNLEKSINHHISISKDNNRDPNEVKGNHIKHLQNLIERLNK